MRRWFRAVAAFAAVSVLALAAGCSSSTPGSTSDDETSGDPVTLTLYTDQHAALIQQLTDAYTKQTGAQFRVQQDATVGQIEAEGAASPADLFLSEDPGPVARLGADGLLEPIDKATLDQVVPGLSSGKDLWVAYAARSRVLFYNPGLISESQLPTSLLAVPEPQYKGKLAWAPSGAFVATTQYLLSTLGKERTRQWLEGVKANGVNEQSNGNVRDTVEAGRHAFGLSNHYYWWIKADEVGGPDKMTSKIYHFPQEDPGNLLLSSGAGVLKSSKQQHAAADFVRWLTSADGGQQVIAKGTQYPVAVGTKSDVVGSVTDVASPPYDMDVMAHVEEAEDLLKQLGMSG
ncbi:MAG: extracellular solute-binding protein [Actinomycetes bacterium]